MKPLHGAGPEDVGPRPPVSMWKLDRLIAGELPEAEAAELRKAVASSPELQRYVAEAGILKSNLTLDGIRKAARGSNVSRTFTTSRASSASAPSASAPSAQAFPIRLREFLQSLGSRRGGMAFAFAAVLGVGLWTWQAREAAPGYQAKGMNAPGIRLILKGSEYDTSDLVLSRSGDTLGFSYRSPYPISTQIWYREESKPAEAMLGPSSISEWKPAMGWRRAAESVILEGEWKRQTIFVVWSKSGFTDGQARRALEKGDAMDPGSDLHTEAFRLAWPD
jgi:hypothetical protein